MKLLTGMNFAFSEISGQKIMIFIINNIFGKETVLNFPNLILGQFAKQALKFVKAVLKFVKSVLKFVKSAQKFVKAALKFVKAALKFVK